jgi:hypothetical protein
MNTEKSWSEQSQLPTQIVAIVTPLPNQKTLLLLLLGRTWTTLLCEGGVGHLQARQGRYAEVEYQQEDNPSNKTHKDSCVEMVNASTKRASTAGVNEKKEKADLD